MAQAPQRVVLAVLNRPTAARACLDAAGYAAGVLGNARIVAMVARIDPQHTVLPSEQVLTAEALADMERRGDALTEAARKAFSAWRSTYAGDADWLETQGDVASEVARHGHGAELLVTASHAGPQDRSGAALHAALLDTGRPVLVVPDTLGATIGRQIAIAWHDDAPATHAVLSAIPFLAAAEHVCVLQGTRAGNEPAPLPTLLTEHQIAAESRAVMIHGDVGQALLDEAKALGADLLVMGAYAHRRFFEALLGGVTRSILHAADLPLLMQH
jgi:nucleotide-binding universal stress UspA family protein